MFSTFPPNVFNTIMTNEVISCGLLLRKSVEYWCVRKTRGPTEMSILWAHWFSYSGLAHRLNRKSYSSLTWSSPFGFWLSRHQLSLLFSKMYVTILHVGFWLSTYQMSLLFNFRRHGDPYEKSYLLCNSRFFEVEYIIFSCRT